MQKRFLYIIGILLGNCLIHKAIIIIRTANIKLINKNLQAHL
jgi:hypothetical protein